MNTEPKKRGRKKGTIIKPPVIQTSDEPVIPKKRGRKPKGGKIIHDIDIEPDTTDVVSNVILHLKCSKADIHQDYTDNSILSHNLFSSKVNDLSLHDIHTPVENMDTNNTNNQECSNQLKTNEFNIIKQNDAEYNNKNDSNDSTTLKNIHSKLKELQYNLHTNNICDKKSACFWCTCDFDNPSIYIPKYQMNEKYDVYGCFCSPECSVAYLMNENIDSSSKFERYQLINNIYSKIYDYKKNIKPAPNPHYTLDKFYGNLSITEYRNLLQHDRLLFIVDKPLTRILPELHEDNDDLFLLNNNTSSTSLKIKKRGANISKNDVVSEKFGNTQH